MMTLQYKIAILDLLTKSCHKKQFVTRTEKHCTESE